MSRLRIAINSLFIGSEKYYFNNQQSILGNGTTATVVMPMFHTDPATTTLASQILRDWHRQKAKGD